MKRLMGVGLVGMVSVASAIQVIDIDFTSPYVNGDLAGQQGWTAVMNTGTEAFSVDATVGEIDTEPFAGSFNSTNGNAVVFNSVLSNVVNDEWSGRLELQFSTTPYPGVTNGVGENVAFLNSAMEIFDFGFSSAPTNKFMPNEADDLSIHVRRKKVISSGLGIFQVTLSKAGNLLTLGELSDADMGWDPAGVVAPDFETDPLVLTWSIRKTRTKDVYSATAVLSNTVTGVATVFNSAENKNFIAKPNVYATTELSLVLSHHNDADEDGNSSLINVSVGALKVDQVSDIPPPMMEAPEVQVFPRNRSVTLIWNAVVDASSYTIYRHDALTDGTTIELASGLTNLTYTDAGLLNETTYYYSVLADFEADGAEESTPRLAATPTSMVNVFAWGPGNVVGRNENFIRSVVSITNNIETSVGSGENGRLTLAHPPAAALYGTLQLNIPTGIRWTQTQLKDAGVSDYIKLRNRGLGAALVYAKVDSLDLTSMTYAFELVITDNIAGDNFATEYGGVRTVIRNGSQWYVGASSVKMKAAVLTIPDLNAEEWAPLIEATTNATELMTAVGKSFAPVAGLTNITAVGFLGDEIKSLYVDAFKVSYDLGGLSSFEIWTADYAFESPDDALPEADPDMDQLSNLYEWGLGGNPLDGTDRGNTPMALGADATGTQFIYLYPRLKDAARPRYYLEETSDLIVVPFGNQEGLYTITVGGDWPGDSNFDTITNQIPMDSAEKFIRLMMEE